MLEELKSAQNRVVGLKQLLRELEANRVAYVFLADDADAHVTQQVISAMQGKAVEFETVDTMDELGQACGIDVGAACAGILRK